MFLREITPRERVWRSIRRQPLDRLPMDFWADKVVWQRLKNHFKTDSKTGVLKALEVDTRTVLPTYVGPPLTDFGDGSRRTEWSFRVRYIQDTADLSNPEYIYPPLGEAKTLAEVPNRVNVLDKGGGYIISSEHYILSDPPLENILAMHDTSLRYPDFEGEES